MKTSEFSSLENALIAARDESATNDTIVTLWCDDCVVDDAIDLIVSSIAGDYQRIDEDAAASYVDAWSVDAAPDWRIAIRQSR